MRILPKAGIAVLLLGTGLAHAADSSTPEQRSVAVSGHGEVDASPDRARLSMSVESTKPDLRAAQAEVNKTVRDYLAQAHQLGAKDEDISTAGLSINAEYDYSGKNGRKFVGYHVTRGITVVVRDLDKIGDFLLRATDAGINSANDPQLESSKADELQRQALAKAATDARAKAQVLADALGVGLGPVHIINASSESSSPPVPRPLLMAKTFAAAAPAQDGNSEIGFSAGQIQVNANLEAEFDLIAP